MPSRSTYRRGGLKAIGANVDPIQNAHVTSENPALLDGQNIPLFCYGKPDSFSAIFSDHIKQMFKTLDLVAPNAHPQRLTIDQVAFDGFRPFAVNSRQTVSAGSRRLRSNPYRRQGVKISERQLAGSSIRT